MQSCSRQSILRPFDLYVCTKCDTATCTASVIINNALENNNTSEGYLPIKGCRCYYENGCTNRLKSGLNCFKIFNVYTEAIIENKTMSVYKFRLCFISVKRKSTSYNNILFKRKYYYHYSNVHADS